MSTNEELEEGEVAVNPLELNLQDELKAQKEKKKSKKGKSKISPGKPKSPSESKDALNDSLEKIEKKVKVEGKQQMKRNKNEFISSTYKTKPCEFYRKGACQKGNECTYSHDFALEKLDTICKYYLTGNCTKGDSCVFSHDLKKYPCKYFWGTGNCSHGFQCRFSHEPINDRQKIMDFIEDNEQYFMNIYQSYGQTNLGSYFLDYLKKKSAEQSNEAKSQHLLLPVTQETMQHPPPQIQYHKQPLPVSHLSQTSNPNVLPPSHQTNFPLPHDKPMYPVKQAYHEPPRFVQPPPPNQSFQQTQLSMPTIPNQSLSMPYGQHPFHSTQPPQGYPAQNVSYGSQPQFNPPLPSGQMSHPSGIGYLPASTTPNIHSFPQQTLHQSQFQLQPQYQFQPQHHQQPQPLHQPPHQHLPGSIPPPQHQPPNFPPIGIKPEETQTNPQLSTQTQSVWQGANPLSIQPAPPQFQKNFQEITPPMSVPSKQPIDPRKRLISPSQYEFKDQSTRSTSQATTNVSSAVQSFTSTPTLIPPKEIFTEELKPEPPPKELSTESVSKKMEEKIEKQLPPSPASHSFSKDIKFPSTQIESKISTDFQKPPEETSVDSAKKAKRSFPRDQDKVDSEMAVEEVQKNKSNFWEVVKSRQRSNLKAKQQVPQLPAKTTDAHTRDIIKREKPKTFAEKKYFNKPQLLEKLGLSDKKDSKKLDFQYDMDKLFSNFEFNVEKTYTPFTISSSSKEQVTNSIKDTLKGLKELLAFGE